MRELSFEENKQYQLNILKSVAEFCDKNGLRYYLAYGTLIGAVRHKGFIPWDDDIDIQMPRADYDRFISTYKNDVYRPIVPGEEMSKHSCVKVVDIRTVKSEKGIKYKQGEELGIDIDVFPIDGQPESEEEFKKYYKNKQSLLKLFHYTVVDTKCFSLKARIATFIPWAYANILNARNILKRIRKINEKFDFEGSKYIGATDSLYNSINNRNPREWYDGVVSLEFEGYEFNAPVGYDLILKKMYGDYMVLPPEEKQVTHHSNKVYLKD